MIACRCVAFRIPSNADTVLKIDPHAQKISELPFRYTCTHRSDGKYKYLGGVLGGDGCIYAIPSDADHVLKIDPATQKCVEIGETLRGRVGLDCNKWQNGFLAADGRIYGIPLKAEAVLCIDVEKQSTYTVGSGFHGFEKWEGGVLARDGAMYCIPLKSKHVLRIAPGGEGAPEMPPEQQATPMVGKERNGTQAGVEADSKAPEADRLLALLSDTDDLARKVQSALESDGYIVLPSVLTRDECKAELDRLWDYVEKVSPSVSRDQPASWYPPIGESVEEGRRTDPWPHTGWKSFADMFQTNGAGWLFSELREKLAARVFEKVYGTRQLHSSKEGFTFHRPTSDGRHPSDGRQSFVCGKPSSTSGEHFDQGHAEVGLQFIQSSTCLIDQAESDASFLCWPGSHKWHQRLTKGTWRGRSHWVPLTDDELGTLTAEGLAPRRVPVRAGDVILWRSDLIHSAAPPLGPSPNFRAVSYTCMLPAALTPPHVAAKKAEAYRGSHTSDHDPSRESWHTSKGNESAKNGAVSNGKPKSKDKGNGVSPTVNGATVELRPFFERPPVLTHRQGELYGLVPYATAAATPT